MRQTLWDMVKKRNIDSSKILRAKEYAAAINNDISKALLDTGVVNDNELADMWHEMYPLMKRIREDEIVTDSNMLNLFDTNQLIQLQFVILKNGSNSNIDIALVNPQKSVAIENYVKSILGNVNTNFYIAVESEISGILNTQVTPTLSSEFEVEADNINTIEEITDEPSSLVKFVDDIIKNAIIQSASDIHIEPYESSTTIRFRKDGVLKKILEVKKSAHNNIVNRIKTITNMDVTNTRILQDGNATVQIGNIGKCDIRVSISPTINGEKATIRILHNQLTDLNIGMLEFNDKNKSEYLSVINKPNGIILFTGPTGSGKTTALFATLKTLQTEEKSIVTIENPVEIKLDGITQVQCDEGIGLTFDNAIKGFLRQDPDIIMVGEIRDEETAKAAVTAANTGHLVFSTLHTNSACSTVVRLEQLGLKPFMIVDTLNAVVNQRLLRKLCPYCKGKYTLTSEHKAWHIFKERNVELYRASGCTKCDGTGYIGRIAVSEVFIPNNEMRSRIMTGITVFELERMARENGMNTIYEDAIDKALKGITSIEEAHRKLYFDNWGC